MSKIDDVINKTKVPLTKKTIIDCLSSNVNEDVVLMHSSLSKMGYVIGGVQSVCDAFVEYFHNKTLVIPSQSADNSNPEDWENPPVKKEWFSMFYDNLPNFDKEKTVTRGMGAIAEELRRRKEFARSNHPMLSFSAMGIYQKEVLANQSLDYSLGLNSPLKRLYDLDASILMIGTDYDNCTALHLAEYLSDYKKEQTQKSMFNGKFVEYKELDYNSEIFNEIGENFEKHYAIKTFDLGLAKCRLINMKELVDFAVKYINNSII